MTTHFESVDKMGGRGVATTPSHVLKNGQKIIYVALPLRSCNLVSEQQVDVMERIQKMGEKFSEYKKTFDDHFKDMEVEVKDWNFNIGKADKEYTVQFTAKPAVRQKT